MVVLVTVAAVRPAGTNHTLGLIEVVVVVVIIIFGSVGGADDVSGDDVRTSGDGGGDHPDHLDQAHGESSETATASRQ